MGHEEEMDRAVKVFDWVVLAAAVLCSVFVGMGIGKKGNTKETTIYGVGFMIFLLGIAMRNVIKNHSWK